jgi:hypothetical protein
MISKLRECRARKCVYESRERSGKTSNSIWISWRRGEKVGEYGSGEDRNGGNWRGVYSLGHWSVRSCEIEIIKRTNHMFLCKTFWTWMSLPVMRVSRQFHMQMEALMRFDKNRLVSPQEGHPAKTQLPEITPWGLSMLIVPEQRILAPLNEEDIDGGGRLLARIISRMCIGSIDILTDLRRPNDMSLTKYSNTRSRCQ